MDGGCEKGGCEEEGWLREAIQCEQIEQFCDHKHHRT